MWIIAAAQRNPRTTAVYGIFAAACCVIYKAIEYDHEFAAHDHILTLSASLQVLAFALLVAETSHTAVEGLSEQTLWAFTIAHIARLSTTLWGPGYVPEDNTSEVYLYQILELVGAVMLVFYLAKLRASRAMRDVGQSSDSWTLLVGMMITSTVMAFITKSTGHGDYIADLLWMFSVWLEAFALGPQVLLSRSSRTEEGIMHFVALTFLASFTFGYFWSHVAYDQWDDLLGTFFWGILCAVVIRFSLCVLFLVTFLRSTKNDHKDGLPTWYKVEHGISLEDL